MAEEYQFRYQHFRHPKHWPGERGRNEPCVRYVRGYAKFKADERGGVTVSYILDEAGNPVAVGRAICSMKDSYCYKLGRRIARGRAVAALYGTEFEPWNGIVLGESPTTFHDTEIYYIPA